MYKVIRTLSIVSLLISVFSGCASVTRGTKDTLVVESNPAGASVRLSTGETGKTPTSFKLSRKKEFDVVIEKEGYESLTVHVSSQVSGKGSIGMAGNVLVGGIIGVGVDAVTGAAKDLKPNPISVTLVPLKKEEHKESTASTEVKAEEQTKTAPEASSEKS